MTATGLEPAVGTAEYAAEEAQLRREFAAVYRVPLGNSVLRCELVFCCGLGTRLGHSRECCCHLSTAW